MLFDKAKELVSQSPVLVDCDFTKPIKLCCDASPYGVGACLMHIADGVEWPVGYASCSLSGIMPRMNKRHLVLYSGSNSLITICMAMSLLWPLTIVLFYLLL